MDAMEEKYVTKTECFSHRTELEKANKEQDIILTKLDTEVHILKKIMYSILGVLISGFAGTIFSILSIGR